MQSNESSNWTPFMVIDSHVVDCIWVYEFGNVIVTLADCETISSSHGEGNPSSSISRTNVKV